MTMFNQLDIQGFKSFEYASLSLHPLTILTGLNSSGKSTVIQAIRMLAQGMKGKDNCLLDGYGDWNELKCNHSNETSLKVITDQNNEISISPDEISKDSNLNESLPDILYVSADRFGPQKSIPVTYNIELGSKGENIVKVIEHFAEREMPSCILHPKAEGVSSEYNLKAWLNIISPGVTFRTEIKKDTDMSFTWFDDHRAMNVGFGLSYTLAVIVALLVGALNKSVVLIENPEAHLHPKGQTEMAKLITQAIEAGAQVIIETHSDHLFDGFRLSVKEKPILSNSIIAYWFTLDENRLTTFEKIHIIEGGRVDNWPESMFDQFEINASQLL